LAISQKVKYRIALNPRNSIPKYIHMRTEKKKKRLKEIPVSIFTAALFTIAKKWNP